MEDQKQAYFQFLDALRDSGATNMFGAVPYLTEVFGLSRWEAKDVLLEWMQSYGN